MNNEQQTCKKCLETKNKDEYSASGFDRRQCRQCVSKDSMNYLSQEGVRETKNHKKRVSDKKKRLARELNKKEDILEHYLVCEAIYKEIVLECKSNPAFRDVLKPVIERAKEKYENNNQ